MCAHVCSQCGHEEPIFGEGGGERIAQECGVNLLGALPLDSRIRQQADSGKPIFLTDSKGPIAKIYQNIADKIENVTDVHLLERVRPRSMGISLSQPLKPILLLTR